MSGPTPGSTAATPNAATNSRDGYTPTITTAATQRSRVNHPPAAYLTSQVSTPRPAIVRYNRGLAASPRVRYTLEMEEIISSILFLSRCFCVPGRDACLHAWRPPERQESCGPAR